eukprot:420483-Pelagomonas_calceolata.AAC.1
MQNIVFKHAEEPRGPKDLLRHSAADHIPEAPSSTHQGRGAACALSFRLGRGLAGSSQELPKPGSSQAWVKPRGSSQEGQAKPGSSQELPKPGSSQAWVKPSLGQAKRIKPSLGQAKSCLSLGQAKPGSSQELPKPGSSQAWIKPRAACK